MAKKKQHSRPTPRVIPRRYWDELDEAQKLFDKKHWAEARDKLQDLDRRLPGQPDILTNLVNAYYELHDTEGYQSASERLLKVERNNAEATLGLAGAYLSNGRPMLALRAFREFVRRWPDHSRANEVRKTIADLDGMMPKLLQDLDLPTEQAVELAAQHETVQSLLAQGRYREVQQAAETILKRVPKFAPVLNNLSLAQWSDGHADQAIASAQRVLEFEPDNVHALSNLIRFLCAAGRLNDARPCAERLKVSLAPATDAVFKKVEGLSYLGDDQGVLELVHQIEQDADTEHSRLTAMFYHLAGVAAWRMGQEGEARSYWRRSLKLSPGFQFAQENLDDLKKTVGERHGPWPFSFQHWVSHKAILDFERAIRPALNRDDAVVERAARRYVHEHPDIAAVAPALLERGDPQGREFVVNLARLSESPELMGLLKDFALSQDGPDKLRIEAAQLVRKAGLLPAGPARIWSQGEWRDLLLFGFEIYDEPELTVHSPQVTEWMQDAVLALRERDVQRAEPLLRKALAEEPDKPDLLNNLAVVYELRGQRQEKEALIREIHERYPDYFFGRVNMARQYTRDGDYERARLLLDPLLRQNRMHTSEFVALCAAEIELHLAQGNMDVARSWFNFWDSTHLSDSQIEQYRSRLGASPIARPARTSRWMNPFRK